MAYITYNGKCVTYNGKYVVYNNTGGGGGDSVSSDLSELIFDSAGFAMGASEVALTSSGTWTSSKVDIGDGTSWLTKLLPSTGGDGDTCSPLLQANGGADRGCIARFTVGTAYCDVAIEQFGVA